MFLAENVSVEEISRLDGLVCSHGISVMDCPCLILLMLTSSSIYHWVAWASGLGCINSCCNWYIFMFAGGRTCRTVTQRVGNMVTTHTECSWWLEIYRGLFVHKYVESFSHTDVNSCIYYNIQSLYAIICIQILCVPIIFITLCCLLISFDCFLLPVHSTILCKCILSKFFKKRF